MPDQAKNGQPSGYACVICGGKVAVIEGLPAGTPCVVSDCRPWTAGREVGQCTQCGLTQRASAGDHEAETGQMYADYEMYSHSSGSGDQKSFFDGSGMGRTAHVLDFLKQQITQSPATILDVGSGSGSGLAAIAQTFPEAGLDGLEPFDDPASRAGANIPTLREVHRNWDRVDGPYDLVTMFHVFEHVPDPLPALQRIRARIADGGTLLIQVPYFPDNPFDLLVADHISHYRCHDIDRLLRQASFAPVAIRVDVVRKEITAIARAATPDEAAAAARVGPDDEDTKSNVASQLQWLAAVQAHIENTLESADGSMGIYGTGPVGAWISAIAGDKVAFFIDDDEDRQGSKFHQRQIYAHKDAPAGTPVYLGFVPDLAEKIRARHADDSRPFFMPPRP